MVFFNDTASNSHCIPLHGKIIIYCKRRGRYHPTLVYFKFCLTVKNKDDPSTNTIFDKLYKIILAKIFLKKCRLYIIISNTYI